MVTKAPLRPGAVISLEPGTYRAVAVEYSGIQSEPSAALQVADRARLQVLAEPPNALSWTRDRWLVDAKEVSAEAALRAPQAMREILHVYDGVIHREWYEQGKLAVRHDLGLDGAAIRRVTYADGKPLTREFFNRDEIRLGQLGGIHRSVASPDLRNLPRLRG